MHDYIALTVTASPCTEDITDLLAAFLGDAGYESFTSTQDGITAYIKASDYIENDVKEILNNFPIEADFSWEATLVEGQDWNSEWEKNYFQPIEVGGECVVHSSFHTDIPDAKYDIVIDPKMAFGTGHHSTTSNMMAHILELDIQGKKVTDMGTGTGILAILAKMKGASDVVGIEIDPFACENACENVRLNGVEVTMICGDASALDSLREADMFFANINRNVITEDIARYASNLKEGGIMLLSGFYREDIPIVEEAALKQGLILQGMKEDKNWVALKLVKNINI